MLLTEWRTTLAFTTGFASWLSLQGVDDILLLIAYLSFDFTTRFLLLDVILWLLFDGFALCIPLSHD